MKVFFLWGEGERLILKIFEVQQKKEKVLKEIVVN